MPGPKINQPLCIFLVLAICLSLFPIPTTAQAQAATAPATRSQSQAQVQTATSTATSILAGQNAKGVLPVGINFAPGYRKLIIDNSDAVALDDASGKGGVLLADYGSFSLWKVPGGGPALNSLLKNSGVQTPSDLDRIGLRAGSIDTSVQPGLNDVRSAAPQLWLVQFVGPVKAEWLTKLEAAGIEIVMYMPSDGYVIWASGAQLDTINRKIASANTELQWAGSYKPAYRLDPQLANRKNAASSDAVKVTVQFYNTTNLQDSLNRLTALGGKIYKSPEKVLNFTDITLEVPSNQLESLAAWTDVFNIESWTAPIRYDEVQGQIVAGNVVSTSGKIGPSAPGYLSWLATEGFPTDPNLYPLVDVVDDGIDNGTTTPLHPDFYQFGIITNTDRLITNQNCTTDTLPDGQAGHGNLNSGIVAAYNNKSGVPYVDPNGFNRGVGISPYGRIGGTKIFANSGSYNISACSNTDAGVVAKSYSAGAKITSNSWGDSSARGGYDASAQAYDLLTRDASSTTAGNQAMLHVFSAGNDGGVTTIGSPGTAKNVFTVGATENVRDNGIADGCAEVNADNADDMATFSSRGPTTDGRVKPEIVAPGTHVQGPASQDSTYDGTGVCGGSGNKYYPNFAQNAITQTLYTWSSGTSHSAPAVAGGMSLLYNYYGRVLAPSQSPTQTLDTTPSPAMAKALTLNAQRYLQGSDTGDTLPSNNQGWGDLNLGGIFDRTPRYLLDQSAVLSSTGQVFTSTFTVSDPAKPFRVTLAWTDAPGSTTGNSYVNNLDLQVLINGQLYLGNVFNKSLSITGGAADTKNNVENVFLPAGITGNIAVRVIATNIAANAIPGLSGNNQDFALVVFNGSQTTSAVPVLIQSGFALSGGDGDGVPEPGEPQNLTITLYNGGTATATNVTGTLTSNTPGVNVISGTASYDDIAVGATSTNTATPYEFSVSRSLTCGSIISFTHTFYYNGNQTGSATISYQLGTTGLSAASTFTSTDVPKSIPDNSPAGINSTVPVNLSGKVGKVKVTININHTYDRDLTITLVSPAGTHITLVARRGASGDNFTNTVFDDSASASISSGSAPFSGTYRPEVPLSGLNGEAISGTWTLLIVDGAADDTGTLIGWKLDVSQLVYNCSYIPPGCDPSIVINHTEDGSATLCGTLSFAFANITSVVTNTITFNLGASRTISVTGNGFANYSLPPGITLDGGDCTNPPVVLDGFGTNPETTSGLILHGSTVRDITVQNFKATQLVARTGGENGNHLLCVHTYTTVT